MTRALEGHLQGVAGVGPAMSARIMAAIELGRRTLALPDERTRLGGPRDMARYLLPRYGARSVEQFGVVQLDARHRVLLTALLSVGTLDEDAGPSAGGLPDGDGRRCGGHRGVSQPSVG